MYSMLLARMAVIEEFGILVVGVGHDDEKCRAPAGEARREEAVGGPIDGAGERGEEGEAVGYLREGKVDMMGHV